uniref:DNA-directed DNA polymerase n=1 Tax=Parascaris univalens TaxID=6257 RepID=A0A914ZL67_PARUN
MRLDRLLRFHTIRLFPSVVRLQHHSAHATITAHILASSFIKECHHLSSLQRTHRKSTPVQLDANLFYSSLMSGILHFPENIPWNNIQGRCHGPAIQDFCDQILGETSRRIRHLETKGLYRHAFSTGV